MMEDTVPVHPADLSWENTRTYLEKEGIIGGNEDIRTRVERLCRYGYNKGPFDRNSIETLCRWYAAQERDRAVREFADRVKAAENEVEDIGYIDFDDFIDALLAGKGEA